MARDFVQLESDRLKEARLYRSFRQVQGEQGLTLIVNGKEVLNPCCWSRKPSGAAEETIDRRFR